MALNLSPTASAVLWTILLVVAFILGISYTLFILSYSFAVATWNKAIDTVQKLFGKYTVISITSPIIVAVLTSLAILVNYLRRRSLAQLFSDFRFGTTGTRSIAICLLATIAIMYTIAEVTRPERFLMPLVDWLYTGFYNFFKSLASTALAQAFPGLGSLAVLFLLLSLYIFLAPVVTRYLVNVAARDLATVSAVAAGAGIIYGAIAIPLAKTSLDILQQMWTKTGALSILGIFGGLIAIILVLVAIEDLRRAVLFEARTEQLIHAPAGLVILNELLKQWFPNVYGTVMGNIYIAVVLTLFAVYFIGIASGNNRLVAASSATFPMMLYIQLV